MGIATGLIADGVLNDEEIRFLADWLMVHDEVCFEWPGDIIAARVKAVLSDGVITDPERQHLLATLQDLIGTKSEALSAATHVCELSFDDEAQVSFMGLVFCLTGNFVYAPREVCEGEIVKRGGAVKPGVSKKTDYVVVGSLGSQEWKHGSYGTKVQKAMELKRGGAPVKVVREDLWAAAL